MEMRLTIPVLLVCLLLAATPAPGMAAGAPHPAMNHCIANSYALPYPSASLDSSAPRLSGYAIPYPRADLDGDSHNCLASGPTRPEDGSNGGSFVRKAMSYAPAGMDGDSSSATVRYAIPYPRADVDGDGASFFVR